MARGAEERENRVVVVGAGPVGLLLAGELRLAGVEVVVLEARATPTDESRASTLHARTMEILDARGLLERMGTPPWDPRGHFGGLPLDLTLPGPYPGQWKVPQTRTEEVLAAWALELGADLRRGHEVRAVRQAGDHVEAETHGPDGPERVRGVFLVACDGEDSTVRRLVGAAFPGHPARQELLRADVAGIIVPDRRFERLPRGVAVAARRNDGVTRVMVHPYGAAVVPRDGAPTYAEVCAAWRRVTGEDIAGGTPLWLNAFGNANRQLARYRHGRVLFAGDAAHQQMPAGGQALNLGLQDAVNLGWKLGAVLRGRVPETLLDTYHRERHAVGRRVLANIEVQSRLLLGDATADPVRELLGELTALEPVRRHLAGMVSGVDIRYDTGVGDHPLLGARLPAEALAAGGAAVTEALRAGRGVLLDLGGRATESSPVAGGAIGREDHLAVVTARAAPSGPLDGASGALVRPDGYLAWVGTADAAATGPDGLRSALHQWFGPVG